MLRSSRIFIGRFCPVHLGHQAIIETLGDDGLVIIGSANSPMSFRHFFNYRDRKKFLELVNTKVSIVGLPDFPGDDDIWFEALDDILVATGRSPLKSVYVGGCKEDLDYLEARGRQIEIINRFTGNHNISATEVRDALLYDRPLEKLLDPVLHAIVPHTFKARWEEFKRR